MRKFRILLLLVVVVVLAALVGFNQWSNKISLCLKTLCIPLSLVKGFLKSLLN